MWSRDCNNQLNSMYLKVDEENCKASGIGNIQYQKVGRFSSNAFWKNIYFIVSAHTFGLGVLMMWEKE